MQWSVSEPVIDIVARESFVPDQLLSEDGRRTNISWNSIRRQSSLYNVEKSLLDRAHMEKKILKYSMSNLFKSLAFTTTQIYDDLS